MINTLEILAALKALEPRSLLVSTCLLLGAGLMLLAAIGIVRLPDLPTRMHATTKAGTLGTSLIMLGVLLAFEQAYVTARVLAIICFIVLTAPVAAHVLGRAGYFLGVPLWKHTTVDRLKENYDPKSHSLHSGFENEANNNPKADAADDKP